MDGCTSTLYEKFRFRRQNRAARSRQQSCEAADNECFMGLTGWTYEQNRTDVCVCVGWVKLGVCTALKHFVCSGDI